MESNLSCGDWQGSEKDKRKDADKDDKAKKVHPWNHISPCDIKI